MAASLAHSEVPDLGDIDAAGLFQPLDRDVDEFDRFRIGDAETLRASGQRVLVVAFVEAVDGETGESGLRKAFRHVALMLPKAITLMQDDYAGNAPRSLGHGQVARHAVRADDVFADEITHNCISVMAL